MTIGELIEALRRLPQDMEAAFIDVDGERFCVDEDRFKQLCEAGHFGKIKRVRGELKRRVHR